MYEPKKSVGQSGGWGKVLGADVVSDEEQDQALGTPEENSYSSIDILDDSVDESEPDEETIVFSYTVGKSQQNNIPPVPSEELPDGFWRAVDDEAQNFSQPTKSTSYASLLMPTFVDLKAVAAGVLFFVITLFVYKFFFGQVASVDVASSPEGALIFINNESTGHKTPHQFTGLKLGETFEFSLKMPGYKTRDSMHEVQIEDTSPQNIFFELFQVRDVVIKTNPEGAFVKLDGEELEGKTPIFLKDLPVAKVSILEIEAEGYIPKRVPFEVLADTQEFVAELAKAVDLNVVTDPPGAVVKVDDVVIGQTPLYDYKLPIDKLVKLDIKKIGYAPISHEFQIRSHQQLQFSLNRLSLAKIPLSREDRMLVRQAQRQVSEAKRQLRIAQNWVRRAESQLKRVEANPKASVSALIDAKQKAKQSQAHRDEQQRLLDETVYRLDDLTERLTNALQP